MPLILKTTQDDDGRRLDRILRKLFKRISPGLPLSAIHRLLRKGKVLVDGVPAGPECPVKAGRIIEIRGLDLPQVPAPPPLAAGRKIISPPPDILYEGAGLLALNKAPGLAVHGKGSLEEQALPYLVEKLPPSLSFRPGPLHRLDKPSSGIVVFSTSLNGARYFSALLRERRVCKRYLAVVDGIIEKDEVWDDLLVRNKPLRKTFASSDKGKAALSIVTPLAKGESRSLILVEIKTGRHHQIRAQASARGNPLSGDNKYGGRALPGGEKGFFLHALSLRFNSPQGETITIKAPLPQAFARLIREFFAVDAGQIDCLGPYSTKKLDATPGQPLQ